MPLALVELLRAPPAAQLHASLFAWLQTAARGVKVLTAPPAPDLDRAKGAQLAPLLSQRLYASLAPPLRQALEQLAPASQAAAPTPMVVTGSDAGNAAVQAELLKGYSYAYTLEALAVSIVGAPSRALVSEPTNAVPHLLQWLNLAVRSVGGRRAEEGGAATVARVDGGLLHRVLKLARLLMRSLPEGDAAPLGGAIPTLLALLASCEEDGGRPLPGPARIDTLEASLDCLDAFCTLPYHTLAPHKRKVLRVLERALDHKKRRVRTAASRCANRWHLLAARTR